ncbi:MAG TPA: ATP-binding protein [Pseudonocardia sp.]
MSTMSAGRRAMLIAVVLVVVVLAALAVLAAVPVVIAVASALLAVVVGVRPHAKATRRRWRPRGFRPAAQRRPLTPGSDLAGPTWTTSWPTVPPLDELPAMRERVSTVLTEWDISDEAAQPTLLVLTELLTNAIEHAAAPIRVTLEITSAVVRVQVHDATPQLRQDPREDPTPARGRGLDLVAALALRQGWTLEPDGKTIWADVPTDWPEPPPTGGVV